MKLYGTDLEKQYDDLKKKLEVLNVKIDKRLRFFQQQYGDFKYLGREIKYWSFLYISTEKKLKIIKLIENDYVQKSGKQLDMFN